MEQFVNKLNESDQWITKNALNDKKQSALKEVFAEFPESFKDKLSKDEDICTKIVNFGGAIKKI